MSSEGLREHAVGTSPGRGASEQVEAQWVGRSHIVELKKMLLGPMYLFFFFKFWYI